MADLTFANVVSLFLGVNTGVAGWGDSFNAQANDVYGQLYWGQIGRKLNFSLTTGNILTLLTVPSGVKFYMTHVMIYRRGVTATCRTIAIGNNDGSGTWNPTILTTDLFDDNKPLLVWPAAVGQLYGIVPTTELLYDGSLGGVVKIELLAGSDVILDFWMYGMIYKPKS